VGEKRNGPLGWEPSGPLAVAVGWQAAERVRPNVEMKNGCRFAIQDPLSASG